MEEIEALRAAYLESYERATKAMRGIDATVLETEPSLGSWSARDVVGHLADWQTEVLRSARHILGGPKPRGQPIKDIDGFNAMYSALRGSDSWSVTEADYQQSCQDVFTFFDELKPEQLDVVGVFPTGRVGRLRQLLATLIRHQEQHAGQLVKWRLRRLGIREEDLPA